MPSIDANEPVKPGALPVALSAVITVAYFAFILTVALNKPLMGLVLLPGVSVGILAAALLLLLCMALSFVFVLVSNRDEENAR